MTLQVELQQLLDIALTTPDLGTVNFNILRALLHEMLKHLNIQTKLIDLDEHESDLRGAYDFINSGCAVISGDDHPQPVESKEENVSNEPKEDLRNDPQPEEERFGPNTPTLMIEKAPSPTPATKTGSSLKGAVPSARSSIIMHGRSESYRNLKKKISELQTRLDALENLPPPAMANPVRSAVSLVLKDSKTPAHDFMELVTLNRKLDASENAIDGLTDMVDALTSDINHLKELLSNVVQRQSEMASEIEPLKNFSIHIKNDKQQNKEEAKRKQEELDEQREKMERCEKKIGDTADILAHLRKVVEGLRSVKASSENELVVDAKEPPSEIFDCLEKLETHEELLQELKAEVTEVGERIDAEKSQASDNEQAFSRAMSKLEACGQEMSENERKITAMNEELRRFKAITEDNQLQIHQMKNNITLLQRENIQVDHTQGKYKLMRRNHLCGSSLMW